MQLIGVLLVFVLIYWFLATIVVGTAIITLLVAGGIGVLTYVLLESADLESKVRTGISIAVAILITAIGLYIIYGIWGLIFAVVCVVILLAKTSG